MTLAAVQDAQATNVAAVVCQTVLVLGGLAAMTWSIRRARRAAPAGVEPWRASLLDFGIWVWLICFAFYAGMNLFRVAYPPPASQPPGTRYVLLQACVFQLSALAMQIALLWSKRSFSPAPFNRVSLSALRIVGEGALAWLAAFPLFTLVSWVWQLALELAQKTWTNLETPLQEPVKILTHSSSITEKALVIFFAVLVAPVAEELFFRGGVYRFLKSRLPANLAVVMASAFFALSHFNLESLLPLFVLGWLLARLYERTGHIAAPMVFHALFNLAMILLTLAFPDSTVSAQPTP